ncbi:MULTISPECIES: RNA polymerase sigma factor [Sphingobacterium]|uniref:RNA polymerase sigma factor n=1 Tax=Sphingobacterium populi TaxID=1812824 RepID=A0ABW5UE39_9SPHI|nr:sigma-70 family RNA polymerase sigma factor [Sphingobacterium sp. CFCC 11742]
MNKFDKQISDLQSGMEPALCFFMDQYANALRFFAFKLIKDKEASAEIVSDSFVKLWNRRTSFQSTDQLKSFLYLVTKNACLDHLKQCRNKYAHDDTFLINVEASNTDILENMIYNELVELVVLEIKKLPKQQAQVFQLAILEGKNTQEICDELQTTANTVYFARSKAVAALKKAFEQKKISEYYISMFAAILQTNFFLFCSY